MKTKEEVLNILRDYKLKAQVKYGITKLGLFGSYARGNQNDKSDIDIIFDGGSPSSITIAHMESELEMLTEIPVQMTMYHDKLSERFLRNINRDVIYV